MTTAEYDKIKQAIVDLTDAKARLLREAEQKAEGVDFAIHLLQNELDNR